MNIGQIANQQRMMMQFVSRSTANGSQTQLNSQLSSLGSFGAFNKSGGTDSIANMLQNMGISGTEGRTAREMAQYQMRVQKQQQSVAASQQKNTAVDQTPQTKNFSARQQFTPISDEATQAMQKLALDDAKGTVTGKAADKTERAKLIQNHLKNVDPSKRTAAFNTMNKVWESETERLGKYIKEKDKNWKDWGDKFDTSILNDYKPGVNVWV